jgi:hypothetical protein
MFLQAGQASPADDQLPRETHNHEERAVQEIQKEEQVHRAHCGVGGSPGGLRGFEL